MLFLWFYGVFYIGICKPITLMQPSNDFEGKERKGKALVLAILGVANIENRNPS